MEYRHIFWKLGFAKHLHRKRIEAIINELGLFDGQFPILDVLDELGTASQKEVANKLHVSAASMTNSVKRLEKNGYLTCIVSSKDRRSHQLSLTEKGKEARRFCVEHFDQSDHAIMKGIAQNELEIFEKVLDNIIEKLKEFEKGK